MAVDKQQTQAQEAIVDETLNLQEEDSSSEHDELSQEESSQELDYFDEVDEDETSIEEDETESTEEPIDQDEPSWDAKLQDIQSKEDIPAKEEAPKPVTPVIETQQQKPKDLYSLDRERIKLEIQVEEAESLYNYMLEDDDTDAKEALKYKADLDNKRQQLAQKTEELISVQESQKQQYIKQQETLQQITKTVANIAYKIDREMFDTSDDPEFEMQMVIAKADRLAGKKENAGKTIEELTKLALRSIKNKDAIRNNKSHTANKAKIAISASNTTRSNYNSNSDSLAKHKEYLKKEYGSALFAKLKDEGMTLTEYAKRDMAKKSKSK